MPTHMMDIFNDDAFSLDSLTTQIVEMDSVPGLAGSLVFNGVGEGIDTHIAVIEKTGTTLSLVQTSQRGAPAPQEVVDKANIRPVAIPHLALEETIMAHTIQNVRVFGTTDRLAAPKSVIAKQQAKIKARLDLTLENLRLGALRGVVLDADGSEILDLFSLFGISAPAAVDFAGALVSAPTAFPGVRVLGQQIARTMTRDIKLGLPANWRIHALAGDNFFDRLIECDSVQKAYSGYDRAERIMGDSYVFGAFEFGGIIYHNYQGTDDNTTVAVDVDDAQFFPVGIPGLFTEFYGPADFFDTVNTVGLPMYSRLFGDGDRNQSVILHAQTNPLPICTRPQVLIRGTIATA